MCSAVELWEITSCVVASNAPSEVVQDAIALCGDKRRLAFILNVSVDDITSWLEGRTQPPKGILFLILCFFSKRGA